MIGPNPDLDLWEKARLVRDRLANEYQGQPGVSLIDIGHDPETIAEEPPGLAVRVHIRAPYFEKSLNLPREMEGIPVRVIVANFDLE